MSALSETSPPLGRGPLEDRTVTDRHLRGLWTLSRLATREGATARAFRSARFGGIAVAISTALFAVALGKEGADITDVLALRALAYASWLFGVLGLWAFCRTDPAASARLAAERGFSKKDLTGAWSFGVGARIALPVFLVAFTPLAVSIATSPTPKLLGARLLLVPGVLVYALIFGACMALVARLSLSLAPGAPRLAALVMVLLPFVVSLVFVEVPSLPGAFAFLIARLVDLGGVGL